MRQLCKHHYTRGCDAIKHGWHVACGPRNKSLHCVPAGMTTADMAELCARIREPGVAKSLRCVRMGPPVGTGGALPDDLVSNGLAPLLTGPRRLEVPRVDSACFIGMSAPECSPHN